ncbi:MAG: bifunctional glutamate N-acetyltransferase/amino-acid acetyltransferase ArgJ [Pseudomonadota bacterium]
MPTRSPLAPDRFPDLPPLSGVRLASGCTSMRYRNRDDLLLVELAPRTAIAGVFTASLTASPPVEWGRRMVRRGKARALVVNAGNANAFTGRAGRQAVEASAASCAKLFGCKPSEVFPASTGTIGEKLPVDKIIAHLPALGEALSPAGWPAAAAAIMTTDTFPKGATRRAEIGGRPVVINGIAKGSGMIAPDLATMLAFLFTDAKLAPAVLAPLLARAAARSFNCITVDGDTSPSDTLLLCATGKARHPRIGAAADPGLASFRRALEAVTLDLAHQVVRDGEGAQKFIAIAVAGAASAAAARRIGLTIGNSPLVKTALAGADPNWGRIVAAIGRSGEQADRDRLSIRIGGILVADKGEVAPGYDETPVARHLQGREIRIEVDVGIGRGRAEVWTCDLTHGYIDINASYRS